MANSSMTDEELKAEGLTRELWNDWTKVMNVLWSGLTAIGGKYVSNSGENTIKYKRKKDIYEVKVNFINQKYLEIKADKNEVEYLSLRYDNNLKSVLDIVTIVVFS